jgi:hypothetical protein
VTSELAVVVGRLEGRLQTTAMRRT